MMGATAATWTAVYANGVTVRHEQSTDGLGTETTLMQDGQTPCVRKTYLVDAILYEQLLDGRAARLALVSHDLRTVYCGDDAVSQVYPLPECAALEAPRCHEP